MTQAHEVKPVRVSRDLPVKLTTEELATTAKEIGRLSRHRSDLEAQAKQAASHWKDRIAGVDAQIHDLAQRAHEGVEPRPVQCEERHDYRVGEVRVVRLDTDEVLEVRPMTGEERQPSLPIATAGEKVADAAAANSDDDSLPPGAEIDDPEAVLDGGGE